MAGDFFEHIYRYIYRYALFILICRHSGIATAYLNSVTTAYTYMSLESTVGIAKVGTRSLRATVPEGIVAFLGIQVGDKLQWKMDIQNNKRVAIVNKKST
jgi:hypothetical protein